MLLRIPIEELSIEELKELLEELLQLPNSEFNEQEIEILNQIIDLVRETNIGLHDTNDENIVQKNPAFFAEKKEMQIEQLEPLESQSLLPLTISDQDILLIKNSINPLQYSNYAYKPVPSVSEAYSISNPDLGANDRFGYAVSIDDNHAIVGSRYEDTGDTNAGSAYIYNVTTGAVLHTINNPTPEYGDQFGYSVAISGNNSIIGARLDDTGANNAGAAYIYNNTTGNLVHALINPTPASGDEFGFAVDISDTYAIVGAKGDDTNANNAGSVYIYNVSTGNLVHTINNPEAGENDQFGISVSISGKYALIGAYGDDAGATNAGSAYVYYGDFDNDGQVSGSNQDDILYGLDGDDIISGLLGSDILYGGDGADTFSFQGQTQNDMDQIQDFSSADGDILDISDIITGFDGSSDINDFVRIIVDSNNSDNAYLMIDQNGIADNSYDFVSVAYIIDGAGLDAVDLFHNNQIIVT